MHNIPGLYWSSVDNFNLAFLVYLSEWYLMTGSKILIHKCNACTSTVDQGMCWYVLVIHGHGAGYN